MIRQLFHSHSKSIASGAMIIAFSSLASRLLGVFRDRILASEFGAGDVLDTYFTAFRIPDTLFNLIVLGAISAGFIPIFLECIQRQGKAKCWEMVNNLLNILMIFLVTVGVVFFFLTPQLIDLIAPGFEGKKLQTTITLTRIMLLSPLIFGVSAIWGAILQSMKQFFIYSIAPILYNIGIIIGVLYFVPVFGVYGLALGVILGALLHMLIQYPSVRAAGYRYRRSWNTMDPQMRKIVILMIPRTLSLATSQINLFIVTIFGSLLTAGSIAVYNLAHNLQSFPLGIFAISLAVAAFPTLSESAAASETKDFIKHFSDTTKQILFFILPASALLIVLRAQIVRVIYGAGLFNWADTINTADALAIFAISLFAQALIPLLSRGFYAYHNTKTPFYVGLFTVALNIGLSFFLIHSPWVIQHFNSPVVGLVLAFSISQIVQCFLLWLLLRSRLHSLQEFEVIRSLFKTSAATFALGLSAHLMKYALEPFTGTRTFLGIFAQGAVAGVSGIVVFTLICYILKSEELFSLIAAISQKLHRYASAPQEAIEQAER